MEFLADILWGVLYLFEDGIFSVIEALIGAIDLGSFLISTMGAWNVLPGPLVYLINSMGIADALAVIGYAYGIRFLLNLIPASLTRV